MTHGHKRRNINSERWPEKDKCGTDLIGVLHLCKGQPVQAEQFVPQHAFVPDLDNETSVQPHRLAEEDKKGK